MRIQIAVIGFGFGQIEHRPHRRIRHMSDNTVRLAAALALSLSAGAARADSNSAFSAANTALLLGYTASPGRLYVPTTGPGDAIVTGSVAPAPQRHKAPARAPAR
jgi:hypothetical protein